jgi:hypothetical protein
MGEGSPGSVPTLPPSDGDSGAERVFSGREPATQPLPTNPSTMDAPHQPATIMKPRGPEAAAGPHEPVTDRPPWGGVQPGGPPPEVARFGPGVPVSQAGAGAESVWRTGHRSGPPPGRQPPRRLRRVLGLALTVVLLIAAGIVLWLRFFDHPAFRVTDVHISGQAKAGCTVDVTGEIATNGSAGTVSYQWVFRPQTQAPQPLNQTVVAGQHAVYVTVAVEGQGHGSATQSVTLDVLGPDTGSASTDVTLSC